jgi:hypothetical protein
MCGRFRVELETSHIFMCEPYLSFHSHWIHTHREIRARDSHERQVSKAQGARARSVTRMLNVCVGAIAARALRTALAHGIHRVRPGAFLHGALLAFREHTCVSLCLSLDSDFFSRAFPQSRAAADQYASLLSTPACFSLPRDCPILRPRAVGCLSRAEGMRLSVCD